MVVMDYSQGLDQFGREAGDLGQTGADAGNNLTDSVNQNLAPLTATSPAGKAVQLGMTQLRAGLSPAGPGLVNGGQGLNDRTSAAMNGIAGQDEANAGLFKGDPMALAGADGIPGTADDLDPDSIDQEAKDKAKDLMGGDQTQQMLQQMLQMGMQAGSSLLQLPQQLAQQISQMVGQMGQQVGQLASKAAEAASKAATDAAASDVGGLDGGLGGGGVGGGGGMDPGMTMPAGLETAVIPMTTSSALQPSGLTPPGTAASGAGNRMPMMPMMPIHGMHGRKDEGGPGSKRDPVIFPESKLYESPHGTEQTFGANPEIESEDPPFGEVRS
jgi:hypothetical protein